MPLEISDEQKQEIIAKLKEAFDSVDGDGDGQISTDDLKAVLEKAGLNPTDEQVQAVIGAADKDGTGTLGFEEFSAAVITVAVVLFIAYKLYQAFQALDADGSGYITSDDLKSLVEQAGYADQIPGDKIDELVANCDADGDGKISFKDFLGALKAYVESL